MEYKMMIPPFQFTGFKTLTKEEAKAFFQWYVGEIPIRNGLLKTYYEETGGGRSEQLDYSVESLIQLWKWFLGQIVFRNMTENEIVSRNKQYPWWIIDFLSDYMFTNDTVKLISDVGIYFGEVFVKNNCECKWILLTKPKNNVDFNRPVVTGFGKMHVNPTTVVYNMTSKAVEGKKDINTLLELYYVWTNFLPK